MQQTTQPSQIRERLHPIPCDDRVVSGRGGVFSDAKFRVTDFHTGAIQMYSMVLMAAMMPAGDTAAFGKHKGGCDGAGCHGTVVYSGCSGYSYSGSGCSGERSGFCGLRDRNKGCNGCNGGGGLFSRHKNKNNCNGGCSGYVVPSYGCSGYVAPSCGCCGTPAVTVVAPAVVAPHAGHDHAAPATPATPETKPMPAKPEVKKPEIKKPND